MTLNGFVQAAKQYLTEDRSACVRGYWAEDVTQFRPVPMDEREYASMLAEIDAFSSSFSK